IIALVGEVDAVMAEAEDPGKYQNRADGGKPQQDVFETRTDGSIARSDLNGLHDDGLGTGLNRLAFYGQAACPVIRAISARAIRDCARDDSRASPLMFPDTGASRPSTPAARRTCAESFRTTAPNSPGAAPRSGSRRHGWASLPPRPAPMD